MSYSSIFTALRKLDPKIIETYNKAKQMKDLNLGDCHLIMLNSNKPNLDTLNVDNYEKLKKVKISEIKNKSNIKVKDQDFLGMIIRSNSEDYLKEISSNTLSVTQSNSSDNFNTNNVGLPANLPKKTLRLAVALSCSSKF